MKVTVALLMIISSSFMASEKLPRNLQRVADLFCALHVNIQNVIDFETVKHGVFVEPQARERVISEQAAQMLTFVQRLPKQYQDLCTKLRQASNHVEILSLQNNMKRYDDLWHSPFSEEEVAMVSIFPIILSHGDQADPGQASVLFKALRSEYAIIFTRIASLKISDGQS